jgi:hypothetical protein
MHQRSIGAWFSVAIIAACGSSSPSSGDATVGLDAGRGDATQQEMLDLKLDLHLTYSNGQPMPGRWSVGVRDDADGTLVAFQTLQDAPSASPSFTAAFPGVLQRGRSYHVGITTNVLLMCTSGTANVWLEQLASVSDEVTLTRTYVDGQHRDVSGCDDLYQSVGLPAGTYDNADPIAGGGSNGIEVVVTASGRLYRKRVFVLCQGGTGCTPSMVSDGPTCTQEITPVPGATSLAINGSGETSQLTGTAIIDVASQQLHYTGTVTTWTSPSLTTKCCEDAIDVALVRTGPEASGCP